MKYSELKKHKKHINCNKIKNILSKFNNVSYIGIAFDKLVCFNYKQYTLSIPINKFNYNTIEKLINKYKNC